MTIQDRLRALYVQHGANHGQEAADMIDALEAVVAELYECCSLLNEHIIESGMQLESIHRLAKERDEFKKDLSNLVAIIHRDGGNYEKQHGPDAAYEDAVAICATYMKAVDDFVAGNDALKAELEKIKNQKPVAWRYRTKADWNSVWSNWMPCSKDQYNDYVKASKVHNWTYDVEALYTAAGARGEPYGWAVSGIALILRGEYAEANAKAEAKRIGGTCKEFPIYRSEP